MFKLEFSAPNEDDIWAKTKSNDLVSPAIVHSIIAFSPSRIPWRVDEKILEKKIKQRSDSVRCKIMQTDNTFVWC